MYYKDILKQLDDGVEDFDFPILDNSNFNFSQGRVSVFKDNENWLISFEIVGYGTGGFSNDLYCYGNLIEKKGLITSFDNIISLPNDNWIFNDNGEFVIDPFDICINIWDEQVRLRPSNQDYQNAKINPYHFSPTKCIRFLSYMFKEKFWLDYDNLFSELCIHNPPPLFFVTDKWKHPDVAAGELPSENEFFKSLSLAIEKNDASIIRIKDFNTSWEHWQWADFDDM